MRKLAIIAALLVCGCSSFQTVKLAADGKVAPKGGIPMILPKPEFVVKKVEGSDDQYQVSVTYVPDPTQRYSVRLASTPLAQIDLALALNENGSLTSTSGGVKDQIAPTVLSLFKVASSAAVAFGTGGAFKMDPPTDVKDCVKLKTEPVPLTAWRAKCLVEQLSKKAGSACTPWSADIIARIEPYIGDEDADRDGAMASLFTRTSEKTEEIACFSEVSTYLDTFRTKDGSANPIELRDAFTAAYDAENVPPVPAGTPAPPPKTPQKISAAIVKLVGKAIEAGDDVQLRRIYYVTQDAAERNAPVAIARFDKLLGDDGAGATGADAKLLLSVLRKQNLAVDGADPSGFNRVLVTGMLLTEQKGFDAALKLSPAAWRSRYLTALQKRTPALEKAVYEARVSGGSGLVDAQKALLDVRTNIATLAGMATEFERLQQLNRLLDKMPPPVASQHVSPAGEYEKISQEAAALKTAIDTAIAATLTGDTKAKGPAPLPLRTPWVSAKCVQSSKAARWRFTDGADSPEFIVVLRRDDGTALEPGKAEAERCGA